MAVKPQNLLVIMSDEHNPKIAGYAGRPIIDTPALDALAARGTRFTAAYTPSPICVPARASLATGLPVHRHRAWDNAIAYDGRIEGWAHGLRQRGHHVAASASCTTAATPTRIKASLKASWRCTSRTALATYTPGARP